MSGSPGFQLIGVIARLVPWAERAAWAEEWRAELSHGYEAQLGRGRPAWLAGLSMRLRCLAAVSDALWLRRRNGGRSMLYSDVNAALRAMRRRPGFSASVVLTLSLGIGGTTAIFSVIDPLMLRPLPYPDVNRLAEIHTVHGPGNVYAGVDPEVWKILNAGMMPRVFYRLEAGAPRHVIVTGAGEPAEVRAHAFTPGTLAMMGARPILGRLFSDADLSGDAQVAVIGEVLWGEMFARDPAVIGGAIAVDGKLFTVIGVLPESFKYPDGSVAMWVPLSIANPLWELRGFEAVARLSPGTSWETAQSQVELVAKRIAAERPELEGLRLGLSVVPLENFVGRGVASALVLLAGAVACVLLIACVNAANLLLVQSTARQTELAVRRSLGATSGRLFRQLVTETLLLALTGGMLGVGLAFAGVRAIAGLLPDTLKLFPQTMVQVDGRVLAFSVALSLMTGLLFGAAPALRAARQTRLVSSSRTMTASASVRRAGGLLVVVELALSMVLLVGAALLARSFIGLLSVEPGYQPQGMLVVRINVPSSRYDSVRSELFYGVLKERLRALPGVDGVTISDGVPPRPGSFTSGITLETETGEKRPIGDLRLPYVVVEQDYFRVLGIPIVAGRSFNSADTRLSPASALVDQDLARLLWPGESALGRRFRIDAEEPWLTVVGIAGDVKMMGPDDRTAPYALYYAASQRTPWRYRTVAVRARADAAALALDIRSAVRALDPDQPILDITPAEALFGDALQRQRFVLILIGVFTAVAVLLASVGVYGVTSYIVAQRRREIGLRIALGATPLSMVGAVVAGGLALAVVGGLLGLAAALALSRFLTSQLYGIEPTDPTTLAVVAIALTAVVAAACLVPAIRAGRVSPLKALRVE